MSFIATRPLAPEETSRTKTPMNCLRLLILVPDSHPDSISTALVGYSHSQALARMHEVTLVTRLQNAEAHRRPESSFDAVESVSTPWLDRIDKWALRRIFKYNYGSQAYIAFNYPFLLAF